MFVFVVATYIVQIDLNAHVIEDAGVQVGGRGEQALDVSEIARELVDKLGQLVQTDEARRVRVAQLHEAFVFVPDPVDHWMMVR